MADQRERIAPTDDYEAREMAGRGRVLARDKVVGRKLAVMMAVYGVVFTALCAALLLGADLHLTLISKLTMFPLAALFWFTALTRTVLRTVVTTEEVHVQQGLWGPRIPIHAVRACAAVAPPRRAIRNAQVFAPDVTAKLVQIEYVDDKGRPRIVLLSAQDPELLVAKIEEARQHAPSGIRVAASHDAASSAPGSDAAEAADVATADPARGGRAGGA